MADPLLLLVKHPNESAFAVVAGPDHLGEGADCARRARGEEVENRETTTIRNSGNYFATGFQFRVERGRGASLVLVWAKENGEWKIVAYDVATP